MPATVRLAGGQGFYGDALDPLDDLLETRPDYVVLEALAELTLAILAKDRARDETRGWTRDLPLYLLKLLPAVLEGQTTVITNAGGINPLAAARMVALAAERYGFSGLRIATVVGDDVRAHPELHPPGFPDPEDLLFANVYLGARPIVDALERGAHIVITGRVADAALFCAPLIHRHGWGWRDWDRIAAGMVVGHLLECSGQVSGGNHGGRWWEVPQPWRFGFPLADVAEDGTAEIGKPAAAGGAVDFDTVRQQLLYEIHDPSAYLTPDVTVDLTTTTLEEVGPDRVRVSGTTGGPPPASYKAVAASGHGWGADLSVAFGWPDAEAKARASADIARKRVAEAGVELLDWHTELFGVAALHGSAVPPLAAEPPEVVLRMAWRTADEESCGTVARHIVPMALSAPPPGFTPAGRGRPKPSRLLQLHTGAVERAPVDDHVRVQLEEI